jgi:hypothetical protein
MITRQELGAKMLSHHSGRTSILVVMDRTDFLESTKVDAEIVARLCLDDDVTEP